MASRERSALTTIKWLVNQCAEKDLTDGLDDEIAAVVNHIGAQGTAAFGRIGAR
jgi:hypothetical protein